MELPGVARARLTATLLALALLALGAAGPVAARAATTTATTATTVPGTPVLVTSQNTPPSGFRHTAAQVERIAYAVPHIRATVRDHRGAYPAEYTKGPGQWQVSWFTPGGKEIAQALAIAAGTPLSFMGQKLWSFRA